MLVLTICWTFVPQCYIVILLQFKRQGNVIRREVESDNEGRLPADKDLRSSKHKDVHQKVRKLNRSYHHSDNQDLEKSAYQKRQNIVSVNEEDEIEEGELIEQDCQDTVSKNHLNKPRKAVLKSVIEASSAGQLGVINAMSKDAVCNGATRECDKKHILEVMEKMQKRRERFKEPVTQKVEDNGRKELLDVACSVDDTKNQRPARKRRWGGSG